MCAMIVVRTTTTIMSITKPPRKRGAKPGAARTGTATAKRAVASAARRAVAAPSGDAQLDLGYVSSELKRVVASARTQTKEVLERVVEALLPDVRPVPTRGFLLQARRNAELRRQLLEKYPVLTSAQVAELAGSSASNRAATATRWRHEGRIFGIPNPGTTSEYVYPSFEFTPEGQPRPGLRPVISVFPEHAREWQLFGWLTSSNGWLGGPAPLDLLDEDPAGVKRAAVDDFDTARF
jgi:hypothetical protein